jgi:glycosyltransferase involved in cell wall biosynthesis
MINLPYERLRDMAARAHIEVREKYGVDVTVRKQEQYFTKITGDVEQSETGYCHEEKRNYVKGLVSVVVPCGGKVDLLQETMESIKEQSYPQVEIIIVNGPLGDPDITKSARLIQSTCKELTSACNEGVKQAAGEYILILNPGDLLDKQFLKTAAGIFSCRRRSPFGQGGNCSNGITGLINSTPGSKKIIPCHIQILLSNHVTGNSYDSMPTRLNLLQLGNAFKVTVKVLPRAGFRLVRVNAYNQEVFCPGSSHIQEANFLRFEILLLYLRIFIPV